MDLHQYYRENKDEINSSIMEIASDLAVARLVDKHQMPFDSFVEPEDPDDPDSGTCYKEEYQDEYNRFYDEEYNRLAQLMKFDITSPDALLGTATILGQPKSRRFTPRFATTSRTETATRYPKRISTIFSTSSTETRKPWATSS